MDRRPITSRSSRWAGTLAGWLARKRVQPNWISLCSIVWALAAGVLFAMLQYAALFWQQVALLIAAAACVQLRLICNLLDGMVAIEGGFKTAAGEIYNDFPDRVSDPLILIGVGYCAGSSGPLVVMGWAAALLAVLTAYTRVLGAATGTKHYFVGPTAKPHRMAIVTAAALGSIVEYAVAFRGYVLGGTLLVINVGCIVTVIRRLRLIVGELEHET